jgi:cyclin H
MKEHWHQSSHFQWIFPKDKLESIREECITKIIENNKQQSVDYITAHDQITLCRFYESKILDYCKYFKFDRDVQSTAILYFKRFFTKHSVIEYDPKIILLTCLFLATKVENFKISLNSFLSKLPKAPSHDELTACEWTVSQGIDFHYLIHHLHVAVHGVFLDIQAYHKEQQDTLKQIYDAYKTVNEIIPTVHMSDILLLYPPSQVSWALWKFALKQLNFNQLLNDRLSKESDRIDKDLDGETMLKSFMDRLSDIEAEIEDAISKGRVDKADAQIIDKRLALCKIWK